MLFVTNVYVDDVDSFKQHLQILVTNFPSLTVFDINDYILNLSSAEKALISQVCTILELILVLPPINAVSERSFSVMR